MTPYSDLIKTSLSAIISYLKVYTLLECSYRPCKYKETITQQQVPKHHWKLYRTISKASPIHQQCITHLPDILVKRVSKVAYLVCRKPKLQIHPQKNKMEPLFQSTGYHLSDIVFKYNNVSNLFLKNWTVLKSEHWTFVLIKVNYLSIAFH